MSWVASSIAATYIVGGATSAIEGNQTKQRNKGYINDAYRSALQRQQVNAQDVTEGSAESMNARGMGTIGAAYNTMSPSSALGTTGYTRGRAPATLGEQSIADTNRELGLESHDLSSAHTQALNENNAQYLNTLVGSATNTAQGILGAYGASQMKSPGAGSGGSAAAAPAPSQTLSGSPDELPLTSGAFGLHPLDPIGGLSSQRSVTGVGQPNFAFNV